MRDTVHSGPVDGNERRRPRALHVEKMLDAAQVARALLADRGHKGDRPVEPHAGGTNRVRQRQEPGQAPRVVTDAGPFEPSAPAGHTHVDLPPEDGVEMRGERHAARPPVALPRLHVSRIVDEDVEPDPAEEIGHALGTPLLVSCGRGDRRQLRLPGQGLPVVGDEPRSRSVQRSIVEEGVHG